MSRGSKILKYPVPVISRMNSSVPGMYVSMRYSTMDLLQQGKENLVRLETESEEHNE